MKHIVESVEEMFHAREPTGEVIIDEVVNAIIARRTLPCCSMSISGSCGTRYTC